MQLDYLKAEFGTVHLLPGKREIEFPTPHLIPLRVFYDLYPKTEYHCGGSNENHVRVECRNRSVVFYVHTYGVAEIKWCAVGYEV